MEDLVIIIPTYNRQHYLRRVIKYYSTYPCKVFICDSSKEKACIESKDNITYLWVPQSSFYQKILDVIKAYPVDFYALSPDDDFLKIETMEECYNELKKNKNYSLGTGGQIYFNEGFNEGFYKTDAANRLKDINCVRFNSKYQYFFSRISKTI